MKSNQTLFIIIFIIVRGSQSGKVYLYLSAVPYIAILSREIVQRLLNRWTMQLDLGSTTGCLQRVVSVHNSTELWCPVNL